MPGITNLINLIAEDNDFIIPVAQMSTKTYGTSDRCFYVTQDLVVSARLAKATELLTRVGSCLPQPFKIIDLAAARYGLFDEVTALKINTVGYDYVSRVNSASCLAKIESCFMGNFREIYDVGSYNLPNTTIEDINIMAARGVNYFRGDERPMGHQLEFSDVYTESVVMGYSDYLTANGFVFVTPTPNGYFETHFQRLLIETLMAKKSHLSIFKQSTLQQLTVFNSRFDKTYTVNLSDIPSEMIRRYEKMIGYIK